MSAQYKGNSTPVDCEAEENALNVSKSSRREKTAKRAARPGRLP